MKLIGLVLVAAALAAGVWWWRRDRGDHPAAPARPAAKLPTATGPDDAIRPAPPRRPGDGVAAPVEGAPPPPPIAVEGAPPVADSVPFEHEVRDPAWAVDQERELKLRLDRIAAALAAKGAKVTITASECRRSLCRIEVEAAATADLSALYGALETPDGLYGWADTIVLGDVEGDQAEPGPAGLKTSIVVQFDRG